MVAIFTTKSNLEDICLDPSKQAWYEMLLKLKEVFINDESMPLDEEDPLFILDNMQVDVVSSKKEYIESIPDNPSLVLQEPCGIFLLDISSSEAANIQRKYGVICQSISSMSHDVLTHKGYTIEAIENEVGYSWKDVFKKFESTPSNSAIIIDAHFFDNDDFDRRQDCYDTRKNLGLKNLEWILDCILPKKFEDVYHVAVMLTNIDEARRERHNIRTSLTNAQIATAINKIKKTLNRGYDICIEVHFFSQKGGFHQLIHNRRILSNYFIVDVPYKLTAFDANGTARASQTISIKPLFELIHIDAESDMKEKRLRYDLDDLYGYVLSQCKNATSELFQNGRKCETFYQIKHRLLT